LRARRRKKATIVAAVGEGMQPLALVVAAAALAAAVVAAPSKLDTFGYMSGGADWTEGECASGANQSPIDITLPEGQGGADHRPLDVYYPVINPWKHGLKLENTGSQLRMSVPGDADNYLLFNGGRYRLSELTLHTPSEHRLRGEIFPMELQLVHTKISALNKTPEYAIISALFRVGERNKWLDQALQFDHLPYRPGMRSLLLDPFHIGGGIRGLHQGYFQYHGSLTVPPCTTNSTVFVLETVQELSPLQVLLSNAIFRGNTSFAGGRGNNRDLQSLGARSVVLHNHKQRGDGDGVPLPLAPANQGLAPEATRESQLYDVPAPEQAREDVPWDQTAYILGDLGMEAKVPALYTKQGKDWSGVCKTGNSQSPIDIKLQVGNPHGDFEMTPVWEETNATMIMNVGTTMQIEANFGYIRVGRDKFTATQIAFYSPSQHTIDGRRSALEMEILHEIPESLHSGLKGRFAVVSVLFHTHPTEESAFLNSVNFKRLPANLGGQSKLDQLVNLNQLKGVDEGYYSYAGSLSRPPCTEGVLRFVMRTVQEASHDQIRRFQSIFNGNIRSLQPLNARGVIVHKVNPSVEVVPKRLPTSYNLPL
jgi:carbonic anhydrase